MGLTLSTSSLISLIYINNITIRPRKYPQIYPPNCFSPLKIIQCWIALKIDPGFAVIVDSARSSRFRVLRRYSWVKIRCKYTRIMDQFCVQFNTLVLDAPGSRIEALLHLMLHKLWDNAIGSDTLWDYKYRVLVGVLRDLRGFDTTWKGNMAEEERFELSEDFHPRWFSRPVHSTALPPLRDRSWILLYSLPQSTGAMLAGGEIDQNRLWAI